MDTPGKQKVLLVPGGDVAPVDKLYYPDGSPTHTVRRLIRAFCLWKQGNFDLMVVTAGRCNKPSLETVPLAQTMARWLIGHGVHAERIAIEGLSRDTYENAQKSWELLQALRLERPDITVVSQWQHTIRFWLAFRAIGVRIRRCPLHYPISLKSLLIEWIFILIHLFDPLGTSFLPRRNRASRLRQAQGG